MYCRFCGNELSFDSNFCGNCGKSVKNNTVKALSLSKDDGIFMVALVLFFAVSSVRNVGISWIFGLIGMGSALILRASGLIKPEKAKVGVWTFSVAILLLELYRIFGFWYVRRYVVYFYGQNALFSTQLTGSYALPMEETWGANTLWLWGLFILFMLLKSNSVKIKKRYTLLVLVLLIAWSVVLNLALIAVINETNCPAELYVLTKLNCNVYALPMFLRRFIVYWFALFAGQGRIGNVRSILFAIFVMLGDIFVLPFVLMSGDGAYEGFAALSLGYMFGAFVLLTGFIKRKKKCLGEEEEHVLHEMR